jgi:hypothetical protein
MGKKGLRLVCYSHQLLPYNPLLRSLAQLWNHQHAANHEQLGTWTLHCWNLVKFDFLAQIHI